LNAVWEFGRRLLSLCPLFSFNHALWKPHLLPILTPLSILARSKGARRPHQAKPEHLQHLDRATVRSCTTFAITEPQPPEAPAAITYPLSAVQLRRGEHPRTTAKP
jgi:hypothetical protein